MIMYLRTIRFQVKQSSMGRFQSLAESTKEAVARFDGLQSTQVAMDNAGNGILVAVWDREEEAMAALAASSEIWAGLAEHLQDPPEYFDYHHCLTLRN
jgi:predicted mannosyl-3-phosphoglycerate phosphatase (HAD superfamily)